MSTGVPYQDTVEDSFVVNDDESIPEKEWMPGPQTGRWEFLQTISPLPSKCLKLNEPPIAGRTPSSKPHEDVLTCEPEPEVAPTPSTEGHFGKSPLHLFLHTLLRPSPARPTPPPFVIIIKHTPIISLLHSYPGSFPRYTSSCLWEPKTLLPSYTQSGLAGIH
ncbi:hypothetical protein O181_055833 [Austropuccinia psidii MF-1]|uniref:Uncharacterized protein n=1 Tax=Austropuccinia psidii MF-1 TaxID=1389203 RepID=A0A9Q3EC06_9BASI|nr:hypothetical protein [Austropuccinia psidii MF-1]